MNRKLSIRIATVGLALAALLATTSPASAHTVISASTNRGAYQAFQTIGGLSYYQPFLQTGGISVWRSPAVTGTQLVTVDYRVFKATKLGWTAVLINGSEALSETIEMKPGYYAPFASRTITFALEDAVYSTMWTIHWKYSNGVEFASTNLDFNQTGDYACGINQFHCHVVTIRGVAAISLTPLGLVDITATL